MLNVAKERFSGLEHFDYMELDFSAAEIPAGYDLMIAALSIRHLG
jgi:tRNA (cmo5U34)-methyltransferase